jgi:predicted neuraminidase
MPPTEDWRYHHSMRFSTLTLRWPSLVPLLLLSLYGACILPTAGSVDSSLQLSFNLGTDGATLPVETPILTAGAVFNSIPDKIGSHAPTITVLPDGELLAAWYSYDGPGELDGAALYTARRSADSAQWQPPQMLVDRPEGDGNPVLYSEGDSVWLFQAVVPGGWSTAGVELQFSSDRGATWGAPRSINGPLGTNVRFPPIRRADDSLLLPAYDDLWQRSLFFTSADGQSWDLLSSVVTNQAHAAIQPSVVELADGRLLSVMRNGGSDWLWVTASDDGGASWSPPLDSGFPNPASPAALSRLSSGNLLLVLNDSNAARTPLAASLSVDDGQTWTSPRALVEGAGDYAYPSVAQDSSGTIHIVYSHDRAYIGHLALNEAWVAAVNSP